MKNNNIQIDTGSPYYASAVPLPKILAGWCLVFTLIENTEFGPAFERSEFLTSFLEITQQSSNLLPVHSLKFQNKSIEAFLMFTYSLRAFAK